jgi:hypothetical protein
MFVISDVCGRVCASVEKFSSAVMSMASVRYKQSRVTAVGFADGSMRVFGDACPESCLALITAHQCGLTSLAISVDNLNQLCVISGGDDQQLCAFVFDERWHVFEQTQTAAHAAGVRGIVVLPVRDSACVARVATTSTDERVCVWALLAAPLRWKCASCVRAHVSMASALAASDTCLIVAGDGTAVFNY